MIDDLPTEPTGSSSVEQFLGRIVRWLRRNRVVGGFGSIVLQKTPAGILIGTEGGNVTATGTSGMVFKGEYNSSLSYSTQDVVVIRGGISAGTYVAIASAPAGADPSQGQYWVSLSPGRMVGSWG